MSAIFLPKSAAWHRHDTCLVDHLHAVEEVRRDTLFVGFMDKHLWQVDGGEGVHGTLDLVAFDTGALVEHICDHCGALLQPSEDIVVLAPELLHCLITLSSLLWRVDHETDQHLAECVRIKLDTLNLVDLIADELVDVVALHIASTETAFAERSFRA